MFRLDEESSVLTQLATGNKQHIVKNHESIIKLESLVDDLQKKVDQAGEIGEKIVNIVEKESSYIKEFEANFQKRLDHIEKNDTDLKEK